MGRVDRPKPWRARYRVPDGRNISKSFRHKADAEKCPCGNAVVAAEEEQ